MDFEFLKTVDDTTGDFRRAYNRCKDAEKQLNMGFPNLCIDLYNQALMIVIKNIYKREGLEAPIVHHPDSGSEPVNADYMHRDSPFAAWLNNQDVLNMCHNLRQKRNKITPAHIEGSEYNATKDDALIKGRELEKILHSICEKLPKVRFRNPGDFHQPCVILLDISESMLGAKGTPVGERPIDELNKAITTFAEDLKTQRDVNACTEVSFITFNTDVNVIQPFKNADKFNVPKLFASGTTVMNEAIETALEIIESQKRLYQREDVEYYRPWLYLLTDGLPTDKDRETSAKMKLKEAIEGNHVVFYPVQIGKWADREHLLSYYPNSFKEKSVIVAEKGHFKELFKFFSNSIRDSIKNGGYVATNKTETMRGIKIEHR